MNSISLFLGLEDKENNQRLFKTVASNSRIKILNKEETIIIGIFGQFLVTIKDDNNNIPYDISSINITQNFKETDYFLPLFAPDPIIQGNSAILIGQSTNNKYYLLELSLETLVYQKLEDLPISINQDTFGFGCISNNIYYVSYINSNEKGIIEVFDISTKTRNEVFNITKQFESYPNRMFKCYFTQNIFICLTFVGQQGCVLNFSINIISNSYTIITENPQSVTINNVFCNYKEIFLHFLQISLNQFIVIFEIANSSVFYLYQLINNMTISSTSHKEIFGFADDNYFWREANFLVLNENYLIIIGVNNFYPTLNLIYIPDLFCLHITKTVRNSSFLGFDFALIDLSLFSFFSLGGGNNINIVNMLQFDFITCKNDLIITRLNQGAFNILDLTDQLINKDDLYISFYELPNSQSISFNSVDLNNTPIKSVTQNNLLSYQGEISYTFLIGGKYSLKYYLFRRHFTTIFIIPSFICTLEIEKECYPSCSQCVDYGDINNHKCTSCKSDLWLLENSQNCLEENNLPAGYYKSTDTGNKIFKICGNNCLSCTQGNTSTNDNCVKCKDQMFFIEDRPQGNCYDQDPGEGYYFDTLNNIYKKCHSSCKTCSEYGENKCESCVDTKYKMNPFDNICYDQCPANYVENTNTHICEAKCHESCETCNTPSDSSNPNCLTCKTGYYSYEDNTSLCHQTCNRGYFLNAGICKKCYNTCSTCDSFGDVSNHNCLSCIGNLNLINKNCIFQCNSPNNYKYIDEYDKFKCVDKCPASYPLLIIEENTCVSDCGTLYEYNSICYQYCPSGTKRNQNTRKCEDIITIIQPAPDNSDNAYLTTESLDTFVEHLDNAVTFSLSAQQSKNDGTCTIIESEEMLFTFYPNSDNSQNLPNKISLGHCESLLRKAYDMSEADEIYIANIIMKSNDDRPYNNSAYEVYDSLGNKLNLSICEGTPIREKKTINIDYTGFNYSMAEYLYDELGINIFDENEEVFNEKCVPLEIDGKDTTLADRKNKIQNKVSLCDENCELVSFNFTTNEVECDCLPTKNGINIKGLMESNEMVSEISDIVANTNFKLFACYKSISEFKYLQRNYGGLISIICIGIEIIFFIIFRVFELKKILVFMTKKFPLASPPKIKNSSSNNIYIYSEKESEDINQGQRDNLDYALSKEGQILISMPSIDKDEDLFDIGEQDPDELNELEYEEALENDKRSFCKFYFDVMSEKQVILSPILYSSVFRPITLRISMLVFCILTFFFINAMFFTEEYISNRYDSNEKLDFVYMLKHELKKCILASLITSIIAKLYTLLIPRPSTYYQVIKDRNDKDFKFIMLKFINSLKKKLILLFIIMIIFSFIFLYFLLSFCKIYKNSQMSWIESTLISICANLILYCLLCLILAGFRLGALKNKNE